MQICVITAVAPPLETICDGTEMTIALMESSSVSGSENEPVVGVRELRLLALELKLSRRCF